jgi:hypothetical protein
MASEQPPPLKRPRGRKVAIYVTICAIWLFFGYGAFAGLSGLIVVVRTISHTGLDEYGLLIIFLILFSGMLLVSGGAIWATVIYLWRTETKSRNKAESGPRD